MFDAVLFEKAGVPTAAIITSPFTSTGRRVIELHELLDMQLCVVAHPITSLTDTELRERARIAAPQVEAILLGRELPSTGTNKPG